MSLDYVVFIATFSRALPDKLFPVLKRADIRSITPETNEVGETIRRKCDVWQRVFSKPRSAHDVVASNSSCGRTTTYWREVKRSTTTAVRLKLGLGRQESQSCWNKLAISCFRSKYFTKVRTDDPTISSELGLSAAIEEDNHRDGLFHLVSTLLSYIIMPKVPINLSKLLDHTSRMRATAKSRLELRTLLSWDFVDLAIYLKASIASDSEASIGDEVSMFCKNWLEKRIESYFVADRKGKFVVHITADRILPASIDSIRLCRESRPPERYASGSILDRLAQHLYQDRDPREESITDICRNTSSKYWQSSWLCTRSDLDKIFWRTCAFSSLSTISSDDFVV